MKILEQLYEGKAKKVFATDDADLVVVSYKDDATAFNGLKKGTIVNKGVVNNLCSNHLFQMLEQKGIPTHFVKQIDDRNTVVKKVRILPLEVIVRNIVAGSLAKRTGLAEGTPLASTVLEFCYKDDALGDPMLNDYHIFALNLASAQELEQVKNMALKINQILSDYLADLHIKLIDFKLEFGKFGDKIILADEISPDTCRFWDSRTGERLDKDRFRRDLGGVEQAYQEVLHRLMGA